MTKYITVDGGTSNTRIRLICDKSIIAENMHKYIECGICGAGVGSDIVNKKLIDDKNYEAIKQNALKYTKNIKHIY